MNALGKYCHDFPRLAKESGYMFQLYRGRINWNDLEKVNVQEIIDERNFQLLEQNLIHVINCNLEREYDVKILDQNFVKLFKLAQLGVDYLSYCELYLDRCVILLQEQLASYQEECMQLKAEIEKKDEELKKSKKKVKIQSQNYKCNKCNKVFVNETYLESHEKRRHKAESESNQRKQLTYSDQAQQTEKEKESISVFTQTLDNMMLSPSKEPPVKEGAEVLKRNEEQELKIDNLKRDLEELKLRLSLAEKTMQEKKNDERSYPSGFPSAVIPIIHSYIPPTYNGHVPLITATPTIVPGIPNQHPSREEVLDKHEGATRSNKPEYNKFSISGANIFTQTSIEETPRHKTFSPERAPAEGSSTVRSGSVNSNDVFANIYEGLKDDSPNTPPQHPYVSLDNHIMDVKPKSDNVGMKRMNSPENPKPQMFLEVEKLTNDFPMRSSPVCLDDELKIESESLSESLEPRTSTPVKVLLQEKTEEKLDGEPIVHVENKERKKRRKSDETRVHDPNTEGKSKSLLQKIVKKKPPKIQELTVNLRNSFSQFYESVSSVGKKNTDTEETAVGKTKSEIVESLHKRLRELGVDPEWSGIPKETMKQKLNILEHNRKLLSKESRLYPYLRRKLQKHVLKKLKSNSVPSKEKIELSADSLEQDLGEPSETTAENIFSNETKEITIYDTDGDSDLEENVTKNIKPIPSSSSVVSDQSNKAQNISLDSIEPIKLSTASSDKKWSEEERETTDFSIFQAGKFKCSAPKVPEVVETEKPKAPNVIDELETDSDFDDELFRELEQDSVHFMTDKSPRKETTASFPAKFEENTQGSSRNAKTENQSILKSEIENKSQLMSKKKVLFAEEPEIFESSSKYSKFSIEKQKIFDLSSIVDDDDWSIESEWTVDKAL